MTALKRAEARYADALVLLKVAPKGYLQVAQAKLILAATALLKAELRRR